MYSVPYSFDFYSNWLGVWIHDLSEFSKEEGSTPTAGVVFDKMYYKNKGSIREYYSSISNVEVCSMTGFFLTKPKIFMAKRGTTAKVF